MKRENITAVQTENINMILDIFSSVSTTKINIMN
jgi:hypothetical protein